MGVLTQEMSLTDDIARLKSQLGAENRKRVVIFRCGWVWGC